MNNQHKPNHPYKDSHYDDEISLIDLFLVLMRRKWLIIGIVTVCTVLGASYALLMQGEPEYRYTTIVELARMDDGTPVESPRYVQSFLSETLIPMVRDELRAKYQDPDKKPPETEAGIPDESVRLLQISSQGSVNDYDDIYFLHTRLLEQLKADLDKIVLAEKENIELQKANVLAEIERLNIEKQRVLERIENAQNRLDTGRMLLNKAPQEATDEVRAMTLLMIQSQMEEAHDQLVTLEDQLYNVIPDKEGELNLSLASLNNSIESIAPTRARMIARQSDNPVGGTGKKLILALSLVLGGMLGIFGAFFAEFLSKARTAAREQAK